MFFMAFEKKKNKSLNEEFQEGGSSEEKRHQHLLETCIANSPLSSVQ